MLPYASAWEGGSRRPLMLTPAIIGPLKYLPSVSFRLCLYTVELRLKPPGIVGIDLGTSIAVSRDRLAVFPFLGPP